MKDVFAIAREDPKRFLGFPNTAVIETREPRQQCLSICFWKSDLHAVLPEDIGLTCPCCKLSRSSDRRLESPRVAIRQC